MLLGVFPQGIYGGPVNTDRLASQNLCVFSSAGLLFLGGLWGELAHSLAAVTEKGRKPTVRQTGFLAAAEKAEGRATLKHRAIDAMAKVFRLSLGSWQLWSELDAVFFSDGGSAKNFLGIK